MVEMSLFLLAELCWLQVDANKTIALPVEQCLKETQAILDTPGPWIGNIDFVLGIGILEGEQVFCFAYLAYCMKLKRSEIASKRGFVS